MQKAAVASQLLVDYDIICLQETWLSKQQEGDLKCMNKKCNAVANSPNDDWQGITVGRKKGRCCHTMEFIAGHLYNTP